MIGFIIVTVSCGIVGGAIAVVIAKMLGWIE